MVATEMVSICVSGTRTGASTCIVECCSNKKLVTAFVLNGAASIVKTILDADSFVGLSVMDFIPTSLYDGGHSSDGEQQPVWWPAFIDPLIAASCVRAYLVGYCHSYVADWCHFLPAQVWPWGQCEIVDQ